MIEKSSKTVSFKRASGDELSAKMREGIRREVLKSANAYLQFLLDERNVPVWTGRLHNSFKPLYSRLKEDGIKTSFRKASPTSKAREYFEQRNGEDSGGPIDADWSDQTRVFLPRKGRKTQITFSFSSDVPYYGANDLSSSKKRNLTKETPWGSQEAAMDVFQGEVARRLPNVVADIITRELNSILLGG